MRLDPPPLHSVPLPMRLALRWVVWRLEERKDKPTKVPYAPFPGPPRRASVRDPTTWGSLHAALERLRDPFYSGLGFVLGDGFVGLDLDGAYDEEGNLRPWAKAILDRAPTLAELSPSRRGIHLYLLGEWPQGKRVALPGGGLEVYGQGRFFTFTGQYLTPPRLMAGEESQAFLRWLEATHFPPPKPPPKRQGLDGPHLEPLELWLRKRGAWDLYLGHWQGRYPSHSEADLALASYLLRYTGGDLAAADALFRRSGLYRPKWDQARGALTYGERTLRKALGGIG